VYEAGQRAVLEMRAQGQLDHTVTYATNTLAIMVAAGNPKGIASLKDLANPDLRLSMPNPETEGVARQIQDSLRKAGGDALVRSVYDQKVSAGSAFLTQIHHRQTPMRILDGKSDAGVVWSSEVRFQQKIGSKITGVPIPDAQNVTATYAAGLVRNATHREAALAWLAYLNSSEARAAYAEFGFGFPQQPGAH
jgi:ABC-type molybdate transport system substrate-binding protein